MSIRIAFTQTLNIVLVAAGVFFIGSQAFTQGQGQGQGQGGPGVTILNTPLPTTVANTVAASIVASTTLPVQIINPVNQPSTVNIGNPVQNRDEPGRNPYQQTVLFNPGSNCTQFVCTASFPAVPAGKRLVVTYASAEFRVITPFTGPSASVSKSGFVGGDQQRLPTVQTSPGNFLAAGPVTFYVDAGQTPSMFLSGQFIDTCCTQIASISGYLVSLP